MSRPNNLTEWGQYVQGLAGAKLYSQTIAANTHSFARTLVEEGATMGEVEQILLQFVRQLRAIGVKVPEEGAFDLVTMALVDEVARKGVSYSPEEATLLEAQADLTGGDDFDDFELEAAFED